MYVASCVRPRRGGDDLPEARQGVDEVLRDCATDGLLDTLTEAVVGVLVGTAAHTQQTVGPVPGHGIRAVIGHAPGIVVLYPA
jgi:hypothetical protein